MRGCHFCICACAHYSLEVPKLDRSVVAMHQLRSHCSVGCHRIILHFKIKNKSFTELSDHSIFSIYRSMFSKHIHNLYLVGNFIKRIKVSIIIAPILVLIFLASRASGFYFGHPNPQKSHFRTPKFVRNFLKCQFQGYN